MNKTAMKSSCSNWRKNYLMKNRSLCADEGISSFDCKKVG